jgi:hypothetical protein
MHRCGLEVQDISVVLISFITMAYLPVRAPCNATSPVRMEILAECLRRRPTLVNSVNVELDLSRTCKPTVCLHIDACVCDASQCHLLQNTGECF